MSASIHVTLAPVNQITSLFTAENILRRNIGYSSGSSLTITNTNTANNIYFTLAIQGISPTSSTPVTVAAGASWTGTLAMALQAQSCLGTLCSSFQTVGKGQRYFSEPLCPGSAPPLGVVNTFPSGYFGGMSGTYANGVGGYAGTGGPGGYCEEQAIKLEASNVFNQSAGGSQVTFNLQLGQTAVGSIQLNPGASRNLKTGTLVLLLRSDSDPAQTYHPVEMHTFLDASRTLSVSTDTNTLVVSMMANSTPNLNNFVPVQDIGDGSNPSGYDYNSVN